MIVNYYNWEDGNIDWEFLNLNWESVVFQVITDTITVVISGIGETVTITKSVLDDITVSAMNINFSKGINVTVSDVNLKTEGLIANNISFT